jgi:hypothetical protein
MARKKVTISFPEREANEALLTEMLGQMANDSSRTRWEKAVRKALKNADHNRLEHLEEAFFLRVETRVIWFRDQIRRARCAFMKRPEDPE